MEGRLEMYWSGLAVLCLMTAVNATGTGRVRPGIAQGRAFRVIVRHQQTQDTTGAEVFRRQCVPCHGNEGKGNGPAAIAFNPPPRDLTDADYMGQVSDEDLLTVIRTGRASMPAFGAVLRPEELQAVAQYVRNLSKREG